MSLDRFERCIFDIVNDRAKKLEEKLAADVVFYHGIIHPDYFRSFRDFVEKVKNKSVRTDNTLAFFLRTSGGLVETAERMVSVMRNHYEKVYFIVPDYAMSAGTILCMSGDKIYMDYSSSLGPIDPQIPASDTGEYVPALGYLDKVKEITEKGDLAPADVIMLRSLDLAKLAVYEQARDLSRDLLKNWLVKYKFKDWVKHRTTKPGKPVTKEQKQVRAEEIAVSLGDHKLWRSHGRSLDTSKLKKLRIEIDDYSKIGDLRSLIHEYNDPLTGFIDRMGSEFYLYNHQVGE